MPKSYEPSIYVASLSDYNNGHLHGVHIPLDATTDKDDIMQAVSEMLRSSKYPNVEVEHPDTGEMVPSAEEWAIHDYEGFGSIKIKEYQDFDTVLQISAALLEHGDVFEAAYSYFSDVTEAIEAVMDRYHGTYHSVRDYAEEYIDGAYSDVISKLPDILKNHIDYEGIAREFELGGDIWSAEVEDGVAIFSN